MMISFDEALERVRAVARPLGKQSVAIDEAFNRVLAAPVIARLDSPRCDVSAMDGYAVREADLAELPARVRVVGESFAGSGWTGSVDAGEAVRIFTGAPVPRGADRVVIQELVRRDGDLAVIPERPGAARHVRKRGEDFQQGSALLPAGRRLDKRAMVAAAAADVAQVETFRSPRVSILSTGDELAVPGTAAERADAIPESVSLGVAALVAEWGGSIEVRQRLRDDLATMQQVAPEVIARSDLVVVTGGASVGERDFAKAMFGPGSLELLFSKVSIKPGKPVWLGRSADALVMGLPGNPTSALVTARVLLAPLLAGLSGRAATEALSWRTATLAEPLGECGPRETFHRARWTGNAVELFAFQDSSAQRVLADADLLVRHRAHSPKIGAGEPVEVLDF